MFWFQNNSFHFVIQKFSTILRKNDGPSGSVAGCFYQAEINIYQFTGTTITANQGIAVLKSLWI